MTRTLLAARLWFEGNRFSPRPTGLAEFRQREWAHGEAALDAAGTATELAAVVDFARSTPHWRIVASRCASASPGGPLDDPLFEAWLDEVLADIARVRPDMVYLSLHGAAITPSRESPELEALRAVRQALDATSAAGPRALLGASFDLHANLPPSIVDGLDAASAYRTYPHVNMRETAARVVDRLRALADGASPATGVLVPTGLLLPSFNMRSEAGPMHDTLADARAIERHRDVIDVSVFGGFPYADVAHAGASVMAWALRRESALRHATALAARLGERAPQFVPALHSPRDALREAAAQAGRIVAVTDPADNPLSGGAADTPGLFAALLAERRTLGSPLQRWPAGRIVFAYFADALAVQRAHDAGVGAELADLHLGGRLSADFGPPVPWRARVLKLTEGRFVNTGPMERGSAVQLGRTAVLEGDGLAVIVTEAVGAANDPAFFALHGIAIATPLLLVVKAKNHFRAAFAPLCAAIIDADVPGPAAADLASLPFRCARLSPPLPATPAAPITPTAPTPTTTSRLA